MFEGKGGGVENSSIIGAYLELGSHMRISSQLLLVYVHYTMNRSLHEHGRRDLVGVVACDTLNYPLHSNLQIRLSVKFERNATARVAK